MRFMIGKKEYEDCTKYGIGNSGTELYVTFHDNTKKTFTNKAGWIMSSDGNCITFERKKAKK